jgi:hypothetical protein
VNSPKKDLASRRDQRDDAAEHWQCKLGMHRYELATRSLRVSKWRCERCRREKWKKPDAA